MVTVRRLGAWGSLLLLTGCCGLFEERVTEDEAYTEFVVLDGARPAMSARKAEEACYNVAWQKCFDAWQTVCREYPEGYKSAKYVMDNPCRDGRYALDYIIQLRDRDGPEVLSACQMQPFWASHAACLADKGYEEKTSYRKKGVCRSTWRLF